MSDRGLPAPHAAFLRGAIERLAADTRLVGVAAGGSFVSGGMDEYSDLDLVVAVEPDRYDEVESERLALAGELGPLLAGFTGEHVGEPRVLICLYGPPLLHVDLKFVRLDDLGDRVEDPEVLWERDGRLSVRLAERSAAYPSPDLQWIEDRFWVWVHYGAGKIGRGELFEAHDFLAFLRLQVLGPLALQSRGAPPTGVRKLERHAPDLVDRLRTTLAGHDATSCLAALAAAAALYGELRAEIADGALVLRSDAERAARAYLEEIARRTATPPGQTPTGS